MPEDDDADPADIQEDGSWICPSLCGASGRCVAGDEQFSIALHLPYCENG